MIIWYLCEFYFMNEKVQAIYGYSKQTKNSVIVCKSQFYVDENVKILMLEIYCQHEDSNPHLWYRSPRYLHQAIRPSLFNA